jgi:hypothetical protein
MGISRMFAKLRKTPAQQWALQIERNEDGYIIEYQWAWWLDLFGQHRRADKVRDRAESMWCIAQRMKVCPHNPANGGSSG